VALAGDARVTLSRAELPEERERLHYVLMLIGELKQALQVQNADYLMTFYWNGEDQFKGAVFQHDMEVTRHFSRKVGAISPLRTFVFLYRVHGLTRLIYW
jgi:hypothetical protein